MNRVIEATKMSLPKRYFVNSMADYMGQKVEIPDDELKRHIGEIVDQVLEGQAPTDNQDGGLYVGAAGVGYMFYHLIQSGALPDRKGDFARRGVSYMTPALRHAEGRKGDASRRSALLLGDGGVNAVSAALFDELGDAGKTDLCLGRYLAAADICKPADFLRSGGDELFVGRAGYLCGAHWLRRRFGSAVVPKAELVAVCDAVVRSGRRGSKGGDSPLMYAYHGTSYLGAAHGLSAILQALLQTPDILRVNPRAEQHVRGAVDYLLRLQTSAGNFPAATDEVGQRARREDDELVHWCHGAPGVAHLLARAYLVWRDDAYLQACIRCGDLVWQRGLLRKGPGLCHGVAGNGYVFLLLHRLTGDPKHLHRALMFASFLKAPQFLEEARTPDNPFSLFEGLAGTACFLADLLTPSKAAFPFFDVF